MLRNRIIYHRKKLYKLTRLAGNTDAGSENKMDSKGASPHRTPASQDGHHWLGGHQRGYQGKPEGTPEGADEGLLSDGSSVSRDQASLMSLW